INFGPGATPYSPTELTGSFTPAVDFGEEYQHINAQLWGEFAPAKNATLPYASQVAPYNIPPDAGTPSMSGFVTDYASAFREQTGGRVPTREELAQVMGYLSPSLVPTFQTLAREFGVYDQWYCDVPSNTYANRSFFQSGQSYGMLNSNPGWPLKTTKAPTIFARLSSHGVPWKVYWSPSQEVSTTLIVNWRGICHFYNGGSGDHWASMEQFYDDAARGELPKYSFIEPRIWFDNNDMHPTLPISSLGQTYASSRSYVTAADRLLHDVYDAIRRSSSPSGSRAENTLLLVTFDEHGGSHDHVVPLPAAPPDQSIGEFDFRFDRLGVRIPTMAISSHIEPGTIVSDPMMGTSVMATLQEKWKLGGPLTNRDASAPLFTPIINRKTARPAS
ncbi:MAG: alkaline phosphatase family protein, partial [Pseudomonadota bacterium]|nr:alkaline phosphatase family protein [Pseudomonadota bacterium]